jgi:hypothetical protein
VTNQRFLEGEKMKKFVLFVAGLMVCLAVDGVLAATYTAIDLNPSKSYASCAYAVSGGQQGGILGSHPVLWNGSAANYIDLNPLSGFNGAVIYGISGNQQVGYGMTWPGDKEHALLWNGTAASYVDLNPSGFTVSRAKGVSGNQQVGYGKSSTAGIQNLYHALLWTGSAASYVDLNPSGFTQSWAYGTNGNQQVGYGYGSPTGLSKHALLWNGIAANYVDLNPSGFYDSYAWGISGNQQVGYGSVNGSNFHALLWNGTAASYVDLNPSGFTMSHAYATSGNQQVGSGTNSATGNASHALLWNGTAASYVDLHQLLPAGFAYSEAYGIDSYGNIAGIAYDSSGYGHAIVWSIPEPGTVGLLALGGMILRRRKH